MSSPGMGINPLAIYDPQTYANQLAIMRRQALAQSLMQSGGQNPQGAYGGLRNAGNAVLGAFLAKRADRQLGELYNPSGPQISNVPNPQPISPQGGMGSGGDGLDPEGNPMPQPPRPVGGQMAQPQGYPSDYQSLPPQAQRLYDRIPHIPGMPATQALNYFMSNPQGYQAEWAKQYEQTELQKNAYSAYGSGSPEAQAAIRGTLGKGAVVNIRPGGGAYNMADQSIVTMPGQNGVQTTFPYGAGGPAVQQMAPGAFEAQRQATAATGLGKAQTTPAIGYDANNMPVATSQAAMLGQPGLNINANNPLNMQPGGQQARYSTPTAGFGTAWDNLSSYARQGVNTVNGIVRKWAPSAPPEYAANVSKQLGVDPNQPLNLQDPNIKGALIDAMRPNETGNRYQGPQGPMLPELPAGQATYMQGQAKDAAERHDGTVAAASESPMRINVLDNIINLSKQGVNTGPGQDWQNAVLGYAANAPVLSKIMGGAKDNVAKFQELQKFTYQNAIRSWQAAGGTGTDAQMQSMAHANPNDHLFPQALQQIAQWGKAAELAVQGKANAQDRFLAQNGQTPASQIKFESAWRNAFDPKVFQYSLMSPAEKLAMAKQLGQAGAKAFLAKQQQLQAMGALP